MILAIFLDNGLPQCCPIPTQSGRPDHSDDRSGVTSGLVRLSLCLRGYIVPLSRSPCQLDGAPGEGCLTEAWPGASGHARWRNEMAHRGNHHYDGRRQRLLTPPPVVSRGLRERRCPSRADRIPSSLSGDSPSKHLERIRFRIRRWSRLSDLF